MKRCFEGWNIARSRMIDWQPHSVLYFTVNSIELCLLDLNLRTLSAKRKLLMQRGTPNKSMSALFSMRVRQALQTIQAELAFESWLSYPQFNTSRGLGRVALLASCLGIALGTHFVCLLLLVLERFGDFPQSILPGADKLGPDRMQLLLQWCMYVMIVSSFHLLEFFTTAIYNPTVATSDAFLINHSPAYTAAALVSPWRYNPSQSARRHTLTCSFEIIQKLSMTEFILKIVFWPSLHSDKLVYLGIIVVLLAQTIRSLAMKTCGESFNHLIQTSKKDNHVLVKHGM